MRASPSACGLLACGLAGAQEARLMRTRIEFLSFAVLLDFCCEFMGRLSRPSSAAYVAISWIA